MSVQVIPTVLEDKDGNRIIPFTKTKCVTDDEGRTVDELIDSKIGDINTALDHIIEMQNSLIGGNS